MKYYKIKFSSTDKGYFMCVDENDPNSIVREYNLSVPTSGWYPTQWKLADAPDNIRAFLTRNNDKLKMFEISEDEVFLESL